jgi:hypothetical protein
MAAGSWRKRLIQSCYRHKWAGTFGRHGPEGALHKGTSPLLEYWERECRERSQPFPTLAVLKGVLIAAG